MRGQDRAATEVWHPEDSGAKRPPSNENLVVAEPFGPYLVYEELGSGGIASLHRAVERRAAQLGCETPVALKRLRPEFEADWELVAAFVQEGQLASQLRHRAIARTHEFGKHDGIYYTATELVEGPTLREVMIQCREAAGAMPMPIAIELLVQICDALDYVHTLCAHDGIALELLHRDVSPANIVLSRTGQLKLIDFGIARTGHSVVGRRPSRSKLGYIAPECADGVLDARTDLFAVGVIAHELLTGARLFEGATDFALVRSVREQPIAPPSRRNPRVTHDLDDIVKLALHRDPEARWQNAAALRFALRNIARNFGPRPDGDEIRTWAAWAFTRKPRRNTVWVKQMLDAIDA